MKIELDPAKSKANIAKHGVDMALVTEVEFDTALSGRITEWIMGRLAGRR